MARKPEPQETPEQVSERRDTYNPIPPSSNAAHNKEVADQVIAAPELTVEQEDKRSASGNPRSIR